MYIILCFLFECEDSFVRTEKKNMKEYCCLLSLNYNNKNSKADNCSKGVIILNFKKFSNKKLNVQDLKILDKIDVIIFLFI